jgi:hypothetical protein
VKMVVMAMGIFGALASLTACKKAPVDDTSALENPPPKPPNCPNLSELKNVTLKDGTIADVRIVQVFRTKLYFPSEMMDRYFVDKKVRSGDLLSKNDLLDFSPDIHFTECPGIIHKFNSNKQVFILSFPRGGRKGAMGNISMESELDGIWVGEINSRKYGGGYNSWIMATPEIRIEVNIRKNDEWKINQVKIKSITEFVEWLATVPAKRDNDQVFTLKVDGNDSDK